MARVAAGDHRAFRAMVERHLDRAVAVAFRMMGSRSLAEDVAQEAFLRLWTHAPRFRPEGARFTTWFTRVLLNLCIDRKRRDRATAPLESAAAVADTRPDPAVETEQAQTARRVAAAIEDLPERQRAALVLCYYEEMSNAEAAAVLDVPVTAVEALLVRARRGLRQRLAGEPV
jgi:RNA polymerase sigma-70 factor (ECF subfamily)